MGLFKKNPQVNCIKRQHITNEYIDAIFNNEEVKLKNFRFENIKFKRCIFKNIYFEDTVFNGCIFQECNFINCKIKYKGKLELNYCTLEDVKVLECKMRNLNIIETDLVQVTFKNTSLAGGNLRGNSYEDVLFEDRCNLSDVKIEDNYKHFEISFVNEKGYSNVSHGTYIGRFNYKKFKNIKSKLDNEKKINLSINHSYIEFGEQFLKCNVNAKYGICFYEGKRAFHRTLTGKRRVLSSIYNIVCGYGEKPARTFILSLIFIVFFAVLYMLTGLKTFSNEIVSISNIKSTAQGNELLKLSIYSIYFSTVTFATVGYGDIMVANGSGMIVSIIEIVIGVFMIGVWTSTLVRKMTR